MDAQLSTMLTIAPARALEARPVGPSGAPRAGIPGAAEPSVWVAPRVAALMPRDTEVSREPSADDGVAPESSVSSEAFVSGTLDMVVYGRDRADTLVEYPVDRDTVP